MRAHQQTREARVRLRGLPVRAASTRLDRESRTAALFLAPSLLVFGLFVYYPLLNAAYGSLTAWSLFSPTWQFIGLENYRRLLADPRFVTVLGNTAFYAFTVVTVSMLLGLGLALLLDRPLAARGIYRSAVFVPYVTGTASVALLWVWIFDPRYGLVNSLLRIVSIPGPDWLESPAWAMPVIVILGVWRTAGFNMVIFLAGLQSIPPGVREAARLDGASSRQLLWHVTLPLLSPTTLFLTVTGLVTSFQVFDAVAIMTRGGPADSTNVLVYFLYQQGFEVFALGRASAVAMVLFAVVMTMTLVQLGVARRWVHYD
jgi:ABC-type sugar transport system permease subunit